jgi:hypothetical protein
MCIFRRACKIAKHNYQRRRVCPSVRPSVVKEQFGSRWADFHGIGYFCVFRKPVEIIKISLKSDKNNWYFTRRQIHILIITHSVLFRMKNVSDKICRENQNTFLYLTTFFSEIVPFMRQCEKILHGQASHRWQYDACAFHAGYVSLQKHTHNIFIIVPCIFDNIQNSFANKCTLY